MSRRIDDETRERAFRMRLERKNLTEISRETGISTKTLSRYERGWIDGRGVRHPGWKPRLEQAWKELAETEFNYGLMLKEERLRTYQELAQLAIAKIKESFPHLRAKTASDAKALLSEIRELLKLIAEEKGEFKPGPHTMIAVKTDVTLNELTERYREVHADRQQDRAVPGGDPAVARDD